MNPIRMSLITAVIGCSLTIAVASEAKLDADERAELADKADAIHTKYLVKKMKSRYKNQQKAQLRAFKAKQKMQMLQEQLKIEAGTVATPVSQTLPECNEQNQESGLCK